jgi:hypothetical protein
MLFSPKNMQYLYVSGGGGKSYWRHTQKIKTAPIRHKDGKKNKNNKLKIIKIIFTQFHYKGNTLAEPMDVTHGTPGVRGKQPELCCIIQHTVL